MLDGYKTKIGSILLAIFTFLMNLPADATIITLGTFVVTVGTLQGLVGALGAIFFGWGVAGKGEKIVTALKK